MVKSISTTLVLAVDGTFKRCSRCFLYKTLREFNRSAKSSDGCRSECRFCNGKMQAADYRASAIAKQRLARHQMLLDDAASALARCTSSDHDGPNPLPVELFSVADPETGRLCSYCKICATIKAARWYQDHLEQATQTRLEYNKKNREEKLARDLRYLEENKQEINERRRAEYAEDSTRVNAINRRHTEKTRKLVFDHYGHQCACCGTTKNLEIDHIEGGGADHRRDERLPSGRAFYAWLVRNNFPDGYQVLCRSCNASKRDGPHCRLNHLRIA